MATKKNSGARKTTGASSKTTASAKKTTAKKTSAKKTASSGASSTAKSHTSVDHEEIRNWAEERGAHPACVRGTGKKGDVGMIRLDFPGYTGDDKLQPISWDEWFDRFDENGLALVFQEKTAGGERSNFNKLVSRESLKQKPKARGAH